jgi:hypothetical protein
MSSGFGKNLRCSLWGPALLMVVLGFSGCKSWDAPKESARESSLSKLARQARDSQRIDPDDKRTDNDSILMSPEGKKAWHNLD